MQWLRGYKFRRTTLMLLCCLIFLAGISFARTGRLLNGHWYVVSVLPLVWGYRRRSVWTLCWLLVLFGGWGWQRGSTAMLALQAYQPLYGQKIMLIAQATNDAAYGTNSQLSFDANHVQLTSGKALAGKIQVSGFGLNAVFQGDAVQVTGKLYPAYGASQGRSSFAQLALIAHHPSLVAEIRRRFAAGMQSSLPEPLAPFAMGLLIGQRATLPADVKQDLLMVGLTHIIAVSGYNLTIMLGASRGLVGKRSKRLSTLVSIGLMAVFLLLAGSSASIIRAAIVSMLSITAGYYGRNFKPLNLILLAAAITAWANPFYVWSDTSWYLSFLAFFGVLVLAPLLVQRVHPSWRQSVIIMVAVESLCAEMMTLPFVLRTFGQMSLIGLPANVLVVTLVPLAMLCSMIAGLAGMLAGPFAGWLAWPARLILTYMLDVAHLLARVPHIFLQQLGLSIPQMLSLYLIAAGLTLGLWGKTKRQQYAKITDSKQPFTEELTA